MRSGGTTLAMLSIGDRYAVRGTPLAMLSIGDRYAFLAVAPGNQQLSTPAQ